MSDGTPPVPGRSIAALIGLRCTGKTTVGRALADRVGARFVDLDEAIADRAGVPHVATIIERDGLAAFRRLEAAELEAMFERPGDGIVVLSTGGGAIEDVASRRRIAEDSFGVWLTAPLAVLRARMSLDGATPRPPLTGDDVEDEFTVLDRRRAPLYEAAAGLTLDVEGRTPADLADEIARAWRR